MSRFRWLVALIGILALTTICLNTLTERHNAAIAADTPVDLLKRIETLEERVALLESQLSRAGRTLPLTVVPAPNVSKHWSNREFNGSPVYIIPLGDAEPKN